MLKAASILTFLALRFFFLAGSFPSSPAAPSCALPASPSCSLDAGFASAAGGYSLAAAGSSSAGLGVFFARFRFSCCAAAVSAGGSEGLASGVGSKDTTVARLGTNASMPRLSAGRAVLPLARFLRVRVLDFFFAAPSPAPSLLSSSCAAPPSSLFSAPASPLALAASAGLGCAVAAPSTGLSAVVLSAFAVFSYTAAATDSTSLVDITILTEA